MKHLALLLLFGCGRFGFDGRERGDATGDSSGDGEVLTDAVPADAPPPTGPFATAASIPSLTSGSGEDDASLSGDMLEVFFDSGRAGGVGGGDIWTASRATTADAWGTVTNVASLNTTGDDATPEISRDGLTLYWVASGASGAKDVWYATRPNRTSPWSAKMRIVAVSSSLDESGPTLTPNVLTMYLSRDVGGIDELFVSDRPTTASAWGTPVAVGTLNSATAFDGEPFINGTDTFIVWSSDRSGNRDLWMARRTDPSLPWGPPQPISEINTGSAEGDPWLSPDEHVIVFSRNTTIFMATR